MFKKKEENLLIGFYTLSVWMTYLGVVAACLGIYFALNHSFTNGFVCLLLAGVCDSFDGKIARMCKRSNIEKNFGIQIDSLADMNSFIFLPVVLAYSMGYSEWYHIVLYTLFTLTGIIRLGYFNVIAEESSKDGGVSRYHGLPVTSTSIILPFIFVFKTYVNPASFETLYTMIMAFITLLFVLNFTFKKPSTKWLYTFLVFAAALITFLFLR